MPLIVIEGIDKSGKKTQARLLARRLLVAGKQVKCIAFPDYRTPLGLEIRRFLRGKVELLPEARQLLYVANRWERKADMTRWLNEGMFVIADRYIPAGLVYGLAQGLDLEWMMKLEERLPKMDLVIVLDVSPEVTAHRCEDKDVYERNVGLQYKVERLYLELSHKLGWKVVDGEQSVSEVARNIWELVKGSLDIT